MELLSLVNILLFAPLAYLVVMAVVTRGLQFALPSDLQLPPPTPIIDAPSSTKDDDTKVGCSPLILPDGGRKTEDRTIAVSSPLGELRQRPFVGMRALDRQNSDVNRRLSEVRHSE